jgi:hypothetical protein
MNTIKKTIMVVSILLFATAAKAQTYYYNETKTFHEEGYIYQADFEGTVEALLRSANTRSTNIDMTNSSGRVTLYNKNNRLTYAEQKNKDGSPIDMRLDFWEPPLEYDPKDRDLIQSIVLNTLSAAEKQRIGEHSLLFDMYINPDTGDVMEVKFIFTSTTPFATIPVSVYRQIELGLKKLKYTPTAAGRKYNFIRSGRSIVLKGW